jgi:oxygen-independent coproporphyrinogen-3 oxidase
LYIHVPFCRHACPYCDFYKTELRDHPARTRLDFTGEIFRELELLAGVEPCLYNDPLATIYFGGGTPSTLSPPGVAELIRQIRARFPESSPEITLEANPENLTPRRCEAWREAGITRLSMGVQSFADRELVLLERLHGPRTIDDAVVAARAAGFRNISLDLMFALPGQTLAGWMENLNRALSLEPDHLSFYGLTWHEGTPFAHQLAAGTLDELPEDLQAEMYRQGAALLEAHGFEHYEISNFARPGFRSGHNQRYWERRDVVGLGPGAHSSLGARRWRNPDDLEGWRAAVHAGRTARVDVENLAPVAATGELLFTLLRRVEGVSSVDHPRLYASLIRWLAAQPASASQWVRCTPERFSLTTEGWLVSDAIIESALGVIDS